MLCDRHELSQIFPYSADSFRRWVKEGLPAEQEPDPKSADPRRRARLYDTKAVYLWLLTRYGSRW